ncbi:hypothetical protein K2173_002683 [Erythroxylum novogranatense]|uniref:Late embryogenesis abundant protein LEA-2 subgroup domain-containing protein n=1 Tax=Erythroxylum novogranatense TaxID=1862640 RepID=A0AAV8SXY5_9ROSI|nr:hypothetical protein K2173_002683 [Erythroxylum novogranatense]
MSRHPETNPHFYGLHRQRDGQLPQTPPRHEVPQPEIRDQVSQPLPPRATHPRFDEQYRSPWLTPAPTPHGQQYPHARPEDGQYQSPWSWQTSQQPHPKKRQEIQEKDRHPPAPIPPRDHQKEHDREPRGGKKQQDDHVRRAQGVAGATQLPEHRGRGHHRVPTPRPTRPIYWLGAVFCAIFWIIVFLGGLIVLIIYLVYRPRNPWFEISSATLNVAYLDTASLIDNNSLLNADLQVLANFTNPNKKMSVDFSSLIIDLYYGSTVIGTQYVEPFSAAKRESRFVNIHMMTSQVRLPPKDSQLFVQQVNQNGILFEVKGVFRVRSNLGILRYSYWLYGHCTIMVTDPPTGVLRATKCRTKR